MEEISLPRPQQMTQMAITTTSQVPKEKVEIRMEEISHPRPQQMTQMAIITTSQVLKEKVEIRKEEISQVVYHLPRPPPMRRSTYPETPTTAAHLSSKPRRNALIPVRHGRTQNAPWVSSAMGIHPVPHATLIIVVPI